MTELSPAVAQVYSAYVEQLGAVLESLRPWWQKLEVTHSRADLRLRWPAGIGSHPRVLAIYRDFHQRFTAAQRPEPGPEPSFEDDDAWGSECEQDPEQRIPIPPERLLVDRLQVEAPSLFTAMIPLILQPLGTPLDPARSVAVYEPRLARQFHFTHRHGIERGIERLLAAATDLRRTPLPKLALAEASEIHQHLHHVYAGELEQALGEAETWWNRELGDCEARGSTPEQALDELYAAHPCGVVSHPRVIGVIQSHWAQGEDINTIFASRAGPEQLLLGWLLDGHHETWVAILSAMPYWPITMDRLDHR